MINPIVNPAKLTWRHIGANIQVWVIRSQTEKKSIFVHGIFVRGLFERHIGKLLPKKVPSKKVAEYQENG